MHAKLQVAVKICAIVDPKVDFYILTPVTLKIGQTRGESVSWCTRSTRTCVAKLQTRQCTYKYFYDVLKTQQSKSGDIVFGLQSGSISRSVHARLQVSVCSS